MIINQDFTKEQKKTIQFINNNFLFLYFLNTELTSTSKSDDLQEILGLQKYLGD